MSTNTTTPTTTISHRWTASVIMLLITLVLIINLTSSQALASPAQADENKTALAVENENIPLHEGLVIGRVGKYGRSPIHTDAIESLIVNGQWKPPVAGDSVTLPDGSTKVWESVTSNDDGWIEHDSLRGSYAFFSIQSDVERVMILHARGHGRVYVNGRLRGGDPYNYGYVRLPIRLQEGDNEFLFVVGRGRLWAELIPPTAPITIAPGDRTLPDLIRLETEPVCGAIIVSNNTNEPAADLRLVATGSGLPTRETALPTIPPMTVRKVAFWTGGPIPPSIDNTEIDLQLTRRHPNGEEEYLDQTTLTLKIVNPTDRHNRTFISNIDGSVQYYAVTPALVDEETQPETEQPGLVLTLHGASVEASGQARAYQPKPWCHVVAPTNRRPFGFDWEDWGRLDFLEVYEHAVNRFMPDPNRIMLTGHSMGGHGTWHVGVTLPDLFAAIAPSAGWISFWSYVGSPQFDENAGPIDAILKRAVSASDTLALSQNYLHYGIYILHGDQDNDVPVEQARTMRKHLGEYHPDFAYYEKPGARHWWGSLCVDWPPLFTFLNERTRPDNNTVHHIDFTTVNPENASTSRWVQIVSQHHSMQMSHVVMDYDPDTSTFNSTTENIARLALSALQLPSLDQVFHVALDGQPPIEIDPADFESGTEKIWFTHQADENESTWAVIHEPPSPNDKGPHRDGPFKHAFRNRMIFVYGTSGTPEENDWAVTKARYDAETFRYRGNGAVDVVPDSDFDPDEDQDRNVIIYGHAGMNSIWEALLPESVVLVDRDTIRFGDRTFDGDLACLFIRPRPGSDIASVGVISGTSLPGLRLTDRLPYFVSGIGYPDCMIIGTETLSEGIDGVRAAGFFGPDWTIESGDFVYHQEP